MARTFCFIFAMMMSALLSAQSDGSVSSGQEAELRVVLDQMKSGELTKPEVFSELDSMMDKERYEDFLGPHILLASMSDLYAPSESERVFRRALSSLDGKQFVIFMMRYFDRAMELDRNYIYDEERIKSDPEYKAFWDNREFYDFTASEFDALAECHDIFSKKDEWRESALTRMVAEEPCSKLKNF